MPPPTSNRSIGVAILAALTALLGAALIVTVDDDDGPGPHRGITVTVGATPIVPATIAVDGADADAKPDDPVAINAEARTIARSFAADARDLDPTGLRGPDTGPVAKLLPPFAADSIPGCRTRFLTTNWSHRTAGASPSLFWLHYTGGPDRPGTRADVDGLTAYGNNPAAAVSWHLNMDRDGNCDYNVPLRFKAWTEGDANSTGVGIEVAGVGRPPYLNAGGYRQLARIYLTLKHRFGIPLRLGAVANCRPTRSGIVTHWMGGACSGGHVDIKPMDVRQVIDTLRRYVANASCDTHCTRTRALRAKHRRTHQRFVKNECARRGPNGGVRHGYCDTLRARNAAVHAAAKRERITLAGSYR